MHPYSQWHCPVICSSGSLPPISGAPILCSSNLLPPIQDRLAYTSVIPVSSDVIHLKKVETSHVFCSNFKEVA